MLIVHDAFELSSQNATLEEEMTRAKVWSDTLFGVVPANKLRAAFDHAFRTHDSTFPINAYEIKAAWENLSVMEAELRRVRYVKDAAINPVKYCESKHDHLDEDGNVELLLGGPGGKTVTVPCADCRTNAHLQRVAEEKAKYQAEFGKPLRSAEDTVIDMFAARQRKVQDDDIVGAAMRRLGVEIMDERNEYERGKMQVTWQKLVRIAEYVRAHE